METAVVLESSTTITRESIFFYLHFCDLKFGINGLQVLMRSIICVM